MNGAPTSGERTVPADEPVVVETPDRRLSGRAVDLGPLDVAVDPGEVAAAVRDEAGGDDAGGPDGEAESGPVTVRCPAPRSVHDHVGLVEPGIALRVRTALAGAARSRGLSAPQDEALASVRAELSEFTVPEADTETARERLAGTESAVAKARERVATVRGRLQAAREADRDTADLREELAAATRDLAEKETERAAAREALDRAEQRAREARDARERRRRLEDRAANLERAARAHLVGQVREEFAAAVTAVPGSDRGGGESGDPFDADPVSAALAVGRVADLRAPAVVAVDRFEGTGAAADWLDAPVVRV